MNTFYLPSRYLKRLGNISLYADLPPLMGGFQHASTGKNINIAEISPLLEFWPVSLGIKFL